MIYTYIYIHTFIYIYIYIHSLSLPFLVLSSLASPPSPLILAPCPLPPPSSLARHLPRSLPKADTLPRPGRPLSGCQDQSPTPLPQDARFLHAKGCQPPFPIPCPPLPLAPRAASRRPTAPSPRPFCGHPALEKAPAQRIFVLLCFPGSYLRRGV